MKERPILFSGMMVRAILEGKKTMTRRICKHQPPNGVERIALDMWDDGVKIHNPYGWKGDRLWVRETWSIISHPAPLYGPPDNEILYRADFSYDASPLQWGDKWRPSIFMPRSICRILLEIINIRVERLQDITEEEAIAEGIEPIPFADSKKKDNMFTVTTPEGDKYNYSSNFKTAKEAFKALWQSINGPGSWEQNPWVWVIEFKKL